MTTKDSPEGLVPAALTWFPMPHEVRETPFDPIKANANRFLIGGAEVLSGVFVFLYNQETGYVYDLSNTISFFLGKFDLPGFIVGSNSGKVLALDIDHGKMARMDAFAILTN